jgi:hypothetical protein
LKARSTTVDGQTGAGGGFKILDGRIRMVDNAGLMEEGIATSGFTQSTSTSNDLMFSLV